MTIVLIGGCGRIGTRLAQKLLILGDTVILVDKKPPSIMDKQLFFVQCDVQNQKLPFNVLEQTDAVINLIGIGFSLRFDNSLASKQKNIIESVSRIIESLKNTVNRPTILINSSSVKYYGDRADEELIEKSNKGEDELSKIVADWENEAHKAEEFGTRVVCIRSAMIISNYGIYNQIRRSGRFGRFYKLSNKNFWQSWIHEEDLINAFIFALQTSTLQGSINAVAPENLKHSDFMNTVAESENKKIKGLVPRIFKKLIFGNIYEHFYDSQHIIASKIIDKGFIFTYPKLREAILSINKK